MNKVILIGRLARDPELRYTAGNNTAVCQTSIAVDRRYKSENQPTADFIPIVAWRQTAEFISKYFSKGSRIAIVGNIQTRTYDDAEGKKHYVTEVVVDEAEFVESKRQDSGYAGQSGLVPPPQPAGGNRAAQQAGQQAASQNANDAFGGDGYFSIDDDDNVPF